MNVTLRPVSEEDTDAMFDAVRESLPELTRWMPWAEGYTRQSADEFVERSAAARLEKTASQRVTQKVGAINEGVQRKRIFAAGRSVDGVMNAIIRP